MKKNNNKLRYDDMSMSSYHFLRVDTYVSVLLSNQTFTNLINRVLGPYCKLLTEFFPLSTYDRSAKCTGHESNGKKQESVSYSRDREYKYLSVCWTFKVVQNSFKWLTYVKAEYAFFRPCHLNAYGPHTGAFFLWFSKEIARGAVRVIWWRPAKLIRPDKLTNHSADSYWEI